MTKEEFTAMVGKRSIGGWWTWERTMAVVCLVALVVFILIGLNLETRLWSISTGAVISMLGLLLGGMLSPRGRKVFTTPLKVKEFKDGKVKVLGQDGKEYKLWYDKKEFFSWFKETLVMIDHRVNSPRVMLAIGRNIGEIWK